jgi:hypothetical protein
LSRTPIADQVCGIHPASKWHARRRFDSDAYIDSRVADQYDVQTTNNYLNNEQLHPARRDDTNEYVRPRRADERRLPRVRRADAW